MPAVTIADLVRATLRHRPDRILVGEVRGPEAFDLLQALNTGHLGSLTTIHANSAEQALTRLAHCVLTANVGLPHRSTREAITLAVHLVVHLARVDGRRMVTQVAHVRGYDAQQDRFIVEPWLPERCDPGRSDGMTGFARLASRSRLSLRSSGCGREATPTGPSGPTSFLVGTWRGTVTIQVNPGEPNPPPPIERRHDVDVRGGPADEHAVAPRHDPLVASVADDGDDRHDGAVARQRAAD